MKRYEICYTDKKKGRYAEEVFNTRKEALAREFNLHSQGIKSKVRAASASKKRATSADAVLVPSTQGQFFMIDADDEKWVRFYKWCAQQSRSGSWYAIAWIAGARASLHRQIMNAPAGVLVDHRDGNTLDCRKANLRLVTRQQNCMNRSKLKTSLYKGVIFIPKHSKWQAGIKVNGKQHYLGWFDTPEEAARSYDEGAKRLHGEYARLNFPVIVRPT